GFNNNTNTNSNTNTNFNSNNGLAIQYFDTMDPMTLVATFMQSFSHTRNSVRRNVRYLMEPFNLQASKEFLLTLFQTKIDNLTGSLKAELEEELEISLRNANSAVFAATDDLEVAAGILM